MGPGEDIAQGVPAGMADFNPITKLLGNAGGGAGGNLIQLLMSLMQGQQAPPPQLVNDPISGGPMSRNPLRDRMIGPSADPMHGMGY
jgi:hypothetical protein